MELQQNYNNGFYSLIRKQRDTESISGSIINFKNVQANWFLLRFIALCISGVHLCFLLGLRFGLLFLDFCCCLVQLYKISHSSFTTLSMLRFAICWFISQDRQFKCFLNESDMKVPPKYTNSATFFHFSGKDTSQIDYVLESTSMINE
jgi:hypothetical protein